MRILAVVVFLLIQLSLNGQNFKSGYVVTREQDTLYGQLEDALDVDLTDSVKFREADKNMLITLKPSAISAFAFDSGRTFRSVNPRNHERVFAKQVESGTIDVLIWQKKNDPHPDMFLVNRKREETVQLTRPKKRRITTEDGKEYTHEDKNYLGSLKYIKGDSTDLKRPRFTEKKIRKDLREFNREHREEYPVSSYIEKRSREYIILGGTAVNVVPFADNTTLRAGVIQTRTRDERTRTFSYLSGIFYVYREKTREVPDFANWNGEMDFRRQIMTFIPVGVRLQTGGENFRPYVYGGLGVAVAKNDSHVVEGSEITGISTQYGYGPNLVVGAGIRLNTGPGSMLVEVAPSVEGIFLNLGYSF